MKYLNYITTLILILVSCLLYTIYKSKNSIVNTYEKEGYDNVSSIPKVIYQTWYTKDLPPKMKECVEKLQKDNPDYKYELYDDNDCRNFIKNNFDNNVLYAFDKLIPGAYKADLWRYCILYKKGGIYLDIKYECYNGFSFNQLDPNTEYFVLDMAHNGVRGIYNAFMVCKPNNEKLLNCINQIVKNVNRSYYGNHALEVTGPLLLNKYFTDIEKSKIELEHVKKGEEYYIKKGNKEILKIYDEYRREQKKNEKSKYYGDLWKKREIYK